jgi:hypothetical protein
MKDNLPSLAPFSLVLIVISNDFKDISKGLTLTNVILQKELALDSSTLETFGIKQNGTPIYLFIPLQSISQVERREILWFKLFMYQKQHQNPLQLFSKSILLFIALQFLKIKELVLIYNHSAQKNKY